MADFDAYAYSKKRRTRHAPLQPEKRTEAEPTAEPTAKPLTPSLIDADSVSTIINHAEWTSRLDVMRSLFGMSRVYNQGVMQSLVYFNGRRIYNKEQACAWTKACILNQNIFITGGAGVGKSFVSKRIISAIKSSAKEKGTVLVCAPTGAAAVNIDGRTLHFSIGISKKKIAPAAPRVVLTRDRRANNANAEGTMLGDLDTGDDSMDAEKGGVLIATIDAAKEEHLKRVTCFVIDEVSMVSAEMFDLLDNVFRQVKKHNVPFGGVQLVCVGDFFQLPPVLDKEDLKRSPREYAFESEAWSAVRMHTIELKQIMRQNPSERRFMEILNRARIGTITDTDVRYLHSRSDKSQVVHKDSLFWANKRKDDGPSCVKRNEWFMNHALSSRPECILTACDTMTFLPPHATEAEELEGIPVWAKPSPRAPFEIKVKVGARIAITRNVYGKKDNEVGIKLFNGQLGVIKHIFFNVADNSDRIDVLMDGESEERRLERLLYSAKQDRNGVYTHHRYQFPISVCFARTIHKSQGSTLSSHFNLNMSDWNGRAPAGLGYVALSRAVSPGLIRFEGQDFGGLPFSPSAFKADPRVRRFYESSSQTPLPFWARAF